MRVVNHVGLTVTDLDRSIAFYRDVVGLDVQLEAYPTGGDWFDTLTHNQGAVINAAMLGDGDFCLQLVEYEQGGVGPAVTGHNRIGNMHVCVNVADVVAKREAIVAAGAYDPTPMVELPAACGHSFYISDPDGVPVEFMQLHSTT